MTIKQEIRDTELKKREETTEKYHQMILDWEAEIRERRNHSIPSKINYTRSMMATVWKSTHMQDISEGRYVPEEIWFKYSEIAKEFFEKHPKRIYVDSHLWLQLFKFGNQINIAGERVMVAILKTIGSERELARKDGEAQENVQEIGQIKIPASLVSFASVGEIIREEVPVTRERNAQEDFPVINVDEIPF